MALSLAASRGPTAVATEGQAARLEGSRRNQIAEGPGSWKRFWVGMAQMFKDTSRPDRLIDKNHLKSVCSICVFFVELEGVFIFKDAFKASISWS